MARSRLANRPRYTPAPGPYTIRPHRSDHRTDGPAERCRSGRTGRSRKPLIVQAIPGFESLPLRHYSFNPEVAGLGGRRRPRACCADPRGRRLRATASQWRRGRDSFARANELRDSSLFSGLFAQALIGRGFESLPSGFGVCDRSFMAAGFERRQIDGGEGGIRTLGRVLPYTRFPVVHLRPLGHLSVDLAKSYFWRSALKNERSKSLHSCSNTPPVTSRRWLSLGSWVRSPRLPQNPALGSAAP